MIDKKSTFTSCPGCGQLEGLQHYTEHGFKWCNGCGVILVQVKGESFFTCHVPRLAPNKVVVYDDEYRQMVGFTDS
jgi:predicted RNA-binding Zn-ribbon protein involved in translation (DUF1610 family)